MGKLSRNKGKAYENHVAQAFRQIGFAEAKRHLEYQADEAPSSRDLDGTQPFAVQIKCWRRTPTLSALEEIQPDAGYPVRMAVLKRTRNAASATLEVAVVDFDVMLKILRLLKQHNLLDELVGG